MFHNDIFAILQTLIWDGPIIIRPTNMNNDITALTIDLAGLDCDALLNDWRWLVPENLSPLCMTVFGDWFFRDDRGAVHFLDLAGGRLKEVAHSKEEWQRRCGDPQSRDEWFMPALAEACFQRFTILTPGTCLGYKLPPLVGGTLDVDNIEVTDLVIHQSMIGQLRRGTKDLPEGIRIRTFTSDD